MNAYGTNDIRATKQITVNQYTYFSDILRREKRHISRQCVPSNPLYETHLVGNKSVDHFDVVGASPVGAAPTRSSFST